MNGATAFRISNSVTAMRAGAATACLAMILGWATPGFSQPANIDPVVVTVNGTPVHESDLALVDELVGRNLPTQDKPERRDSLLKMLVDTILLAQIAHDRNIVDDADIERRVTFARNQGLMNHLLREIGQQAVTDESIHKAYEDVVVKAANNEPEVHLRHLVFLFKDAKDEAAVKSTEDKAEGALARIKKGEDFGAVVADVSDDPVTKARGGDFGWRTRPELGKEYADLAFAMKTGDVSPLIKTAVGWHIIKLEDRRTRKPVELEKVRDRVAAMVSATAQFELVEKARAAAKIERPEGTGAVDTGKAVPQGN